MPCLRLTTTCVLSQADVCWRSPSLETPGGRPGAGAGCRGQEGAAEEDCQRDGARLPAALSCHRCRRSCGADGLRLTASGAGQQTRTGPDPFSRPGPDPDWATRPPGAERSLQSLTEAPRLARLGAALFSGMGRSVQRGRLSSRFAGRFSNSSG